MPGLKPSTLSELAIARSGAASKNTERQVQCERCPAEYVVYEHYEVALPCARRVAAMNLGWAPLMMTPILLSYVAVTPRTCPSANGNSPHGCADLGSQSASTNAVIESGKRNHGQVRDHSAWTGTIFVAV